MIDFAINFIYVVLLFRKKYIFNYTYTQYINLYYSYIALYSRYIKQVESVELVTKEF